MKKLFIVLLAICWGLQGLAQADPGIQSTLLSPNPLQTGAANAGKLTTLVINNSVATAIPTGCVVVEMTIPTSLVEFVTPVVLDPTSSPVWTLNFSSTGVVRVVNTGGPISINAVPHPVVLNVKGITTGGPLLIGATITYVSAPCAASGNINPGNDNATTSVTTYTVYNWTGVNSTQWTDPGNWTPAGPPTAADKAMIPNVAASGDFLPVLNASVGINDLQIDANATVDLGGQTFTINGAVTGTGTLSGSATSSLTITGAAGSLNFTPASSVVKDLNLSANATATLGSALDIAAGASAGAFGTVTINSGATLTTGGNLTIKSNNFGTARVGTSAGTITGDVTVERYIANPQRAWHLLSTNTFGSQTIYNSWQEGGAVVTQKGTWLTSGASLLPGFDATSVNGSSILIHDQTVPSWTTIPVASTNNISTPLSSRPGYFLFVRGDRSSTAVNSTVSPTVLRSKGALKQGTLPAVTVSSTGTGRTLVGNPYASAINMETIFAPGGINAPNLDQNMMIWDPALAGTNGVGGYRSIVRTGINTYTQTPVVLGGTVANNSTRFIHSGQAFFLKATGANASIVFTEAVKTPTTTVLYNPIVGEKEDQTIIANLMMPEANGRYSLIDGIRISYNSAYTALLTDDIEKMTNFNENIASYRNGTKLIVEKRPMIGGNDTIFLQMTKTTPRNYRFQIGTIDFVQADVTAFLEDTYLKTKTKLDLTGGINYADFSITSEAASANPNRFIIVFKGTPVPTTITLNAKQQAANIAVDWKAADQNEMKQYEVEKSLDGVTFSKVETQAATGINGSTAYYNWLDVNAVGGDNFYRIRSMAVNGDTRYSDMVKVKMPVGNAEITIYPNPVTDKTMRVKFANMYKGNYRLSLIGGNGQIVFTKDLIHPGGNTIHPVNITGLPGGSYLLEITGPNNNKTVITLSVLN